MNPATTRFILYALDQVPESLKEKAIVVIIDGKKINDFIKLYKFLKERLSFPNYSHPNLDSLDEILNDPDWLEAQKEFYLEIKNYSNLLFREPQEKKKSFLNIIYSMTQGLGYEAVYIENSELIQNDLQTLSIPFEIYPSS